MTEPSNTQEYLLVCTRETLGQNLGFHAVDGRGYTTNVERAHTYTLPEMAELKGKVRDIDIFVDKSLVMRKLCWKVDSQYVDSTMDDSLGPFVAYKKRKWDGNDLYFVNKAGQLDLDVENAEVYESIDTGMQEEYSFIPVALANENKRPTFAAIFLSEVKSIG